ncbi:unnamed protein product [Eruca vesicaria subsp. sativa]|uniref:Uncharacterized protein n=1 Tax=Eruca vesicaria subsp. sativa TaxID=29727 RepID=A0ABC8JNA7_ERUVS|nr:unnamed protein product [Eruca vesicaria subsp. sativa]
MKNSLQNRTRRRSPREERRPHRNSPTATEKKQSNRSEKIDPLPTLKADHPRTTAATTAPYLQRTRRPTREAKPCAQEARQRSHADPEKTSKAERPNMTRRVAKEKTSKRKEKPRRCRTRAHAAADRRRKFKRVLCCRR